MSLQTRSIPIEEVQRIQKSLWRQSAAVKDSIRDAAGRVLEHVRSRETFLLEQVELLEHAKFEMLMENLIHDGGESEANADMNEAFVEFASMELGVEAGFRTLCEAIANFGPEMLKDGALKKPLRKRNDSASSSLEDDFCVLDDESSLVQDSVASLATVQPTQEEEIVAESGSHSAFLEKSPVSDWLLNDGGVIDDLIVDFQSFFGEASRYAFDYGYWLKKEEAEKEGMEEEEEEGWEKWLHPSSIVADGAEEAFFSEYMRFLRQSSVEDWMKDAPVAATEIRIPAPAMIRTESLTTNKSENATSSCADGWLLHSRLTWHQNHPHHYGECADSCRVMPDQAGEMEIENIGDLACLTEAQRGGMENDNADIDDAFSQWILKPKKGKAVVKVPLGLKGRKTTSVSDWLLEESEDAAPPPKPLSSRKQSDVAEWLKTTEKELVKGLCKANEPCSGFSGCLSDINCKKGKTEDDEEKEKEDEDKEEKESSMDADSDEWVMPKKKHAVAPAAVEEDNKVSRFLRSYHAMTQDYWLTS